MVILNYFHKVLGGVACTSKNHVFLLSLKGGLRMLTLPPYHLLKACIILYSKFRNFSSLKILFL